MDYIKTINDLEEQAAQPEAEASEVRWLQAEQVVEALDSGMSQQELADHWVKPDGETTYSQSHVKWVKKTWETFKYYSTEERPRWYDAYNSDEVRKGRTAEDSDVRLLRYYGEEELQEVLTALKTAHRGLNRLYNKMYHLPERGRLIYRDGSEGEWLGAAIDAQAAYDDVVKLGPVLAEFPKKYQAALDRIEKSGILVSQ